VQRRLKCLACVNALIRENLEIVRKGIASNYPAHQPPLQKHRKLFEMFKNLTVQLEFIASKMHRSSKETLHVVQAKQYESRLNKTS
jgi:hypothetical protein